MITRWVGNFRLLAALADPGTLAVDIGTAEMLPAGRTPRRFTENPCAGADYRLEPRVAQSLKPGVNLTRPIGLLKAGLRHPEVMENISAG